MNNVLTEGSVAPDFSLPDGNGAIHRLRDYGAEGTWVLLYFYPKDDTPGCTIEACNFRDKYDVFQDAGIAILGVSKDSPASHTKFTRKFSLPFPLLSDESTEMIQAYGAWGESKFMGRTFMGVQRVSYLIDPSGIIRTAYPKVKPADHATEILRDFQKLNG